MDEDVLCFIAGGAVAMGLLLLAAFVGGPHWPRRRPH